MSLEFHNTLHNWSQADDPDDLANRVLGGQQLFDIFASSDTKWLRYEFIVIL